MQPMPSSSITLNTLPTYLPLIEEANKRRFNNLPNIAEVLRNIQLTAAHDSTEKSQIAFSSNVICTQVNSLVKLAKEKKAMPNYYAKVNGYRDVVQQTSATTARVVTLGSTKQESDISVRVQQYLAKYDAFMEKAKTDLSELAIGKLYVRDLAAFKEAKERFVAEFADLVVEGEQWLKLLQEFIGNPTKENEKSQENFHNLQDKVLQALNILPLQVQLTEALFIERSTYKTHKVAKGLFYQRMVSFSQEIRAIYNNEEPANFVALQDERKKYQDTYKKFIRDANEDRQKLGEILKTIPEIPSRQAIATHLNTVIMNDTKIEAETRKQSEDIITRIVSIYEDSRKKLEAAQAKVDTHIDSSLKHRIDRLLNGIDWKDFSRVTWKTSIINWTKYSEITN